MVLLVVFVSSDFQIVVEPSSVFRDGVEKLIDVFCVAPRMK